MNNFNQLFQKRVQQKQQQAAKPQEFRFTFEQSSQLDTQLRKPRSRAFMEALEAVDLPSATDQEIIDALKEPAPCRSGHLGARQCQAAAQPRL